MTQYRKEQIASMLEKAASEIEKRDERIRQLEEELSKQTSTITKTASFTPNSIDEEFGNMGGNWGSLGEASDVRVPGTNAKRDLEDFLSSLA